MSYWKETTLGEIAKVQTGPFGSQLLNEQYISGGTPIITVEHIKDFRISHQDYPSVTEEDRKRLEKYSLNAGDIVFSRVGSVDLSALVEEEQDGWLFSSRMLRVRPKGKEVDPLFLSYYFRLYGVRKYINNVAVGTTMPSINTSILSSIPVSLPPYIVQIGIGRVLQRLDQKIALLRRQNQTLGKTAQTLFKHWFIDFEFPCLPSDYVLGAGKPSLPEGAGKPDLPKGAGKPSANELNATCTYRAVGGLPAPQRGSISYMFYCAKMIAFILVSQVIFTGGGMSIR